MAISARCGVVPRMKRMKVFSACGSSIVTLPLSICPTAQRDRCTTVWSCDVILWSRSFTMVPERCAASRRVSSAALDRPLSAEGETARQADMDAIRDLIEEIDATQTTDYWRVHVRTQRD